jgi:hypothetical protein
LRKWSESVPRKTPNRDKAKELFWRKAVARQLESGLTQAVFCEKEGLSANSFSWWKREGSRRDADRLSKNSTPKAEAIFVPVAHVSDEDQIGILTPIAEIDLTAKVVRIFAGIDRHSLHEVIAALREVRF